jgi:hypothetical protein
MQRPQRGSESWQHRRLDAAAGPDQGRSANDRTQDGARSTRWAGGHRLSHELAQSCLPVRVGDLSPDYQVLEVRVQ